jgi:hypothetical protein
VECDGASLLLAEVAAGRRVAAVNEIFQRVAGKRPIYRAAFGFNRITHRGHRASSPSRCETGRRKLLRNIAKNQRQSSAPKDKAHTGPIRVDVRFKTLTDWKKKRRVLPSYWDETWRTVFPGLFFLIGKYA